MMWVSIYPPQWQNATLRHSGLPNWPTLQGRDCVPPHPTCSASHGTRCHTLRDNNATPLRAQVITGFLLPTLQIWLLSIFGQRVAKNYPTPVDVYQLTRVLQQVWQSKLFRPLSSPQVSAAYIMAAIPAVDCHETSCICDFKIEGWSHFRAHISCCYLKSNESCINCC